MKNLVLCIALLWFGYNLVAQNYPLSSAIDLEVLVNTTDAEHYKPLIFNNNYVEADRFIYFAVLRGLAIDKMPISTAKQLLHEDNFVPKCKICASAKKALNDYVQHGMAYNGPKNPYPELTSKKTDTRHQALKALLDKYTSTFKTLLQLSPLEEEELNKQLGLLKKKGT